MFVSRSLSRSAPWLIAAVLCSGRAAISGQLAAPTAEQVPYLPASDSELLQEVPSAKDPAVLRMRALRSKFDAAPQELASAIELANAYIDYSRQVGDAHYAGYAEAVIAPWFSLPKPPASALLSQAIILQYRHQFADARALLAKTLQLEPRNAQAWLTLATLDMVQGQYQAAARGCSQLTASAGPDLGLTCIGTLRSYTGQASQSLALLQRAQQSATRAAPAYQAWLNGLVAETAERLGNWELAESQYKAALQRLPDDNFLLVAYADFLLDRDRAGEVLPLLADHTQSDTAFLRIALAQSRLHAADSARYNWVMAARFEALRLRGSEYFGREESRFALTLQRDPETALSMAQRNWEIQRAPWDARVFLEAALAAHKPQAAAEVVKFIEVTRLEDPIVLPLARQVSAQSKPAT